MEIIVHVVILCAPYFKAFVPPVCCVMRNNAYLLQTKQTTKQ